MGLVRRLQRSFRPKKPAPTAVTDTSTVASSTAGPGTKPAPAGAGAAAKPASRPARPSADGGAAAKPASRPARPSGNAEAAAKPASRPTRPSGNAEAAAKPASTPTTPPAPDALTVAAATQAAMAFTSQTGCGCGRGGGDRAKAAPPLSGASGAAGGGSGSRDGSGGAEGCDSNASAPTPSKVAADGSANRGAATGTIPVLDTAADKVIIQQLAAQISELRAELASLRVTVQSLESRMGHGPLGLRRLPRTISYQPETRSLMTSTMSLEEGPNCVLKDDEFYDALAISLQHIEVENDKRDELRKKKNEEIQEKLRMQKQQESSEDSKVVKKENDDRCHSDERPGKAGNDQTKSANGKTDADKESQDVEKTNESIPSDDSQTKLDQQPPNTAKSAPEKPSRSLSKPSPAEDTTDSVSANSSPAHQETGPAVAAAGAAAAGAGVAVAPQPPLPPAAAPRGGCSGNCSQLGHPLAAEIDRIVTEQLNLVTADVTDGSGWTLFAQQGDMQMYKKDAPADNCSVDPLKAVSKAHGVTARELCKNYWDTDVRLEWETTVDRVTVLARPDPSTVVCHQLHRRVWPAQQRDAVFWSHLCRRRVKGQEWSIAVNHSISDHPDESPDPSGAVRLTMTSALAGRDDEEVGGDRSRLHCDVAYSAQVNPGGWVPTVGLRHVYKREYPRFLQRFTAYATQKSSGQPVEV